MDYLDFIREYGHYTLSFSYIDRGMIEMDSFISPSHRVTLTITPTDLSQAIIKSHQTVRECAAMPGSCYATLYVGGVKRWEGEICFDPNDIGIAARLAPRVSDRNHLRLVM